jgi:hypothetical protein
MRSPNRSPSMESLESRRLYSASPADVPRPNFVFILTDDLDAESVQYMPKVQELIGGRGLTFDNAFVTNPVCCPSNVSILTGQYSYNTGILHNVPPLGGFQKFTDMRTDGNPLTQGDENTLATWLSRRLDLHSAGLGPVAGELRRVLDLLQLQHERERDGGAARRR